MAAVKAWHKAFAAAIGITMIAFGVALLSSGSGTGPCGRFCGFQQTFVTLFGQGTHNLVFGIVWAMGGALFAALPWLRRKAGR